MRFFVKVFTISFVLAALLIALEACLFAITGWTLDQSWNTLIGLGIWAVSFIGTASYAFHRNWDMYE